MPRTQSVGSPRPVERVTGATLPRVRGPWQGRKTIRRAWTATTPVEGTFTGGTLLRSKLTADPQTRGRPRTAKEGRRRLVALTRTGWRHALPEPMSVHHKRVED